MKTPPPDLAARLLDVSEAVLAADPPPRLQDVAARIGASRASLYYYFSGRDDLVGFLLASHARAAAEALDAARAGADDPLDRVRRVLLALAGFLATHPGVCAGLLGAMGSAGRLDDVLHANDVEVASRVRDVVRDAERAGVLAVADVEDAVNAVMGGLLLGVLGRASRGRAAGPDVVQRLVDQALRGLGAGPGDPGAG